MGTQETNILTEHSPLSEVLIHFPSKAALAEVLGISRQYVSQMDMSSPLPRVYFLELRYELRPDLYSVDGSSERPEKISVRSEEAAA